jgi:hypothetical protein
MYTRLSRQLQDNNDNMMQEDLLNLFKKKLNAPITDPVAEAEKLLMTYFGNGDSEDSLRDWVAQKGFSLNDRRGIEAIDILLSTNDHDQEIIRLILWVANQPLPIGDAAHARKQLKENRDWVMGLIEH